MTLELAVQPSTPASGGYGEGVGVRGGESVEPPYEKVVQLQSYRIEEAIELACYVVDEATAQEGGLIGVEEVSACR